LPAPWLGLNAASRTGESTFTDRDASLLLSQIADGLGGHNARKMLGAFDIGKMTGGPAFRQQVSSFFSQTATIRAHFNLVQTGLEQGRNFATVDAEIEAAPLDDRLPPIHKQAQLRFLAEGSDGAWKFTDVQPRTFFSSAP
jgi:hypothetical protein